MSTKSLLLGAGLIILGVLIGFGMGMSSQCTSKNNPPCYENAKCYKQKVKKGKKCKKPSFKQRLVMELNLSEEQIQKVDTIFIAKREMRKAQKTENKLAIKEINAKTNSGIRAILNAEQQAKFDEMIKNCPKNKKACNQRNPKNCNLQKGNI